MVQGQVAHLCAYLIVTTVKNKKKMLNIKRFVVNPLQENCYVVSDETRECVIIDCGACYADEYEAIGRYVADSRLAPKHLLCTHAHFDHCMGVAWAFETYGLRPEVGAADELLLRKVGTLVETLLGVSYDVEMPPSGRLLHDGDTILFGAHRLQAMATPGHTPGGLCFYCEEEKAVFTGDTLFRMSIGRTDFPGGSWALMMGSLRLLSTLPANTKVYAGHGEPTTIGDELKYNPYMSH